MSDIEKNIDELFNSVSFTNGFEDLKKELESKTAISDSNDIELIKPAENNVEEIGDDLISNVNSVKALPDEISESDVLISTHNSEEALPNSTPISTVNSIPTADKSIEEIDLISSHNSNRLVEL